MEQIINEATEMRGYGKTTYVNVSAIDLMDAAKITLDKALADDPSLTKSIVKLNGYSVIISKDETETN